MLEGTGLLAQILVQVEPKGACISRNLLCCNGGGHADTSSPREAIGRSHRVADARRSGQGGLSPRADRQFLLPEGPLPPGEVPAAA